MREIIFRGKRLNSGKWIFGDLICDDIDTYIRQIYHEYWEQVDPDTVSQFTGLRDCEGNRIYEGDILQDNNGHFGVVIWKEKAACFLVKWIVVSEFGNEEEDDCFDFEIVGNKWDNPELLERE